MKKENNIYVSERLEKFFRSRCVDIKDYDNDYILPKILMTAILRDLAYQWEPLHKEHKREVEQIRYYI
jgi:hypothetical protein